MGSLAFPRRRDGRAPLFAQRLRARHRSTLSMVRAALANALVALCLSPSTWAAPAAANLARLADRLLASELLDEADPFSRAPRCEMSGCRGRGVLCYPLGHKGGGIVVVNGG